MVWIRDGRNNPPSSGDMRPQVTAGEAPQRGQRTAGKRGTRLWRRWGTSLGLPREVQLLVTDRPSVRQTQSLIVRRQLQHPSCRVPIHLDAAFAFEPPDQDQQRFDGG